MVVHVSIHGGGNDQRTGGRHNSSREGVISQSQGKLGDAVNSGGGDDNNVCLLRQGHMLNAVLGVRVKGVDHHCPVGETAKGQGRDKLGCAIAHDDVNQRSSLHQLAGQVQSLVTGYAPSHSQDYVFIF